MVQKGENLSKIAPQYYVHASLYPKILEANRVANTRWTRLAARARGRRDVYSVAADTPMVASPRLSLRAQACQLSMKGWRSIVGSWANDAAENLETISDAGFSYKGSAGASSLRAVPERLLKASTIAQEFRGRAREQIRADSSRESLTDAYERLFDQLMSETR